MLAPGANMACGSGPPHGHKLLRRSDLCRKTLAWPAAVQPRRCACGAGCVEPAERATWGLSVGVLRAASGRLVQHGALQLTGGVFVLGASIVGGIGVARSRHARGFGFMPRIRPAVCDKLFTQET